MPPVTLKVKRLSVTADVPRALVAPLQRAKRRIVRRAEADGAVDTRFLSFETPELHVSRRDPVGALASLRAMLEADGPVGASRAPSPAPSSELARQVAGFSWYHTIDLPGGVVTPGVVDHRPLVPDYGIPHDLVGQRVLDVATADGFWAFEFERRGAEVVAVDVDRLSSLDLPPALREELVGAGLDRPTGVRFGVAAEALGSRVRRVEQSVYDVGPAELGRFDLVHLSDALLHLEDPVAALRAVRGVTRGRALIVECFDPTLEAGAIRYLGGWDSMTWWLPSLDALAQMVLDAGFGDVELRRVYKAIDDPSGHWRASLVATAGPET